MAITPVTLGPYLRAWAQAGLCHILCDGPVALPEAGRSPAMPPASVFPPAVPVVQGNPAAQGMGEPGAEGSAASRPGVAEQDLASESLRQQPGGGLALPSCEAVLVDIASWPEPWGGWAAKAAPAPVLWTYHELGADVTGIGRSSERSSFFKDMIAELRLPRGSSVFWPCAMPAPADARAANLPESSGSALWANGPIFAAGVARFNPRVLVVFGQSALADMGIGGACSAFRQVMVAGRLLVVLPSIEELLAGASQRSSAVSLLRGVFAPLNLG